MTRRSGGARTLIQSFLNLTILPLAMDRRPRHLLRRLGRTPVTGATAELEGGPGVSAGNTSQGAPGARVPGRAMVLAGNGLLEEGEERPRETQPGFQCQESLGSGGGTVQTRGCLCRHDCLGKSLPHPGPPFSLFKCREARRMIRGVHSGQVIPGQSFFISASSCGHLDRIVP